MTDEELKIKCKERAKIFQQAMESCKSSSLMDCIEWFADRIADLEDKLANADYQLEGRDNEIAKLEEDRFAHIELEDRLKKENAELKEINTHTLSQLNLDNGELIIENEKLKKENAKLKEKLNFSTQYYQGEKAIGKLTKAKEIIKDFLLMAKVEHLKDRYETVDEAEQFLKNDGCPDVMCEDCTKEDCEVRQLGLVEVEK